MCTGTRGRRGEKQRGQAVKWEKTGSWCSKSRRESGTVSLPIRTKKKCRGFAGRLLRGWDVTPHASSGEQNVKKKQGWYKPHKQKANSFTFIKRFRFDSKPNTSLYSFLPRLLPSSQTDAQTDTVYLFIPRLTSCWPLSSLQILDRKKEVPAVIPLHIILHYRREKHPGLDHICC